jgi:hypothetical protein
MLNSSISPSSKNDRMISLPPIIQKFLPRFLRNPSAKILIGYRFADARESRHLRFLRLP